MNVVFIGAHPDDAEILAGGTLLKWAQAGFDVTAVSVTNGCAGHYSEGGRALAQRREKEMARAAAIGGYRQRMLTVRDGELTPALELRHTIVRLMRELEAQIVVTHRPWDYHPDHRYAGQLVQDAAFTVTVPHICSDMPRLTENPAILFVMDPFTRPAPFSPDVAVDVGDVMETKWRLVDAMESQVYEWLPWLAGTLDDVPIDAEARIEWLQKTWDPWFADCTERYRGGLQRWYGAAAEHTVYAEYFECCEYGRQPSPEEWRTLLPFLPESPGGQV